MARLGDVVQIDRSSVQPNEILAGQGYLGLEHIESGGRILGAKIVDAGELQSSKFAFDKRHVLFGKLRPNLAKVARPDFSGICSTDIVPLLPGSGIDRDYLAQFLLAPATVAWASSRTAGVNLPRLSPSVLQSLEVPLPPLREQRRIADILDRADELRAKRRHALVLLDELADSLFEHMFGDAIANDHRWPVVTVSDFVSGFSSGKSIVGNEDDDEGGGPRVLKVSAVTSGRFRPCESKPLPTAYAAPPGHYVREGDLLFSRANTAELVGATAYIDSAVAGLVLPDKLWKFQWQADSGVDPRFVWKLFSRPEYRRLISEQATGSSGSMKNVSQAAVLALPAMWPPGRLQAEFGEKLAKITQNAILERAHLTKLDDCFSSLQQQAFSGQL